MELLSRQTKGKYQDSDLRKKTGSHYTPTPLADFLTQRILLNYDLKNRSEVSIFDPAVGDGELLLSLAQELLRRGVMKVIVAGSDINGDALKLAEERLSELGVQVEIDLKQRDFTETLEAPNLFSFGQDQTYDLIIANPPYVRTQALGSKHSSKLSRDFSLDGRIDLYYVFLLGIKKFMHSETVAGFIVSNRFMTTKAGASVRSGLWNQYQLHEVWDLGDSKIFEASVLPAVLVFSEKNQKEQKAPIFTSMYTSSQTLEESKSAPLFDALLEGSGVFIDEEGVGFEVKKGHLKVPEKLGDVWRVSNSEIDDWFQTVKAHTQCFFGDLGKIRVGVKTTADKIFIRTDWSSEELCPEAELLKPLITHHCANRYKQAEENPRKILYPHAFSEGQKTTVDLTQYPRALQYLEKYRSQLEARDYLIEAGRNWFELWVAQEPALWQKPKMVFRDICDKPTFWLDESGAIVNGDCYWLTLFEGMSEDYLWLAVAVANSSFIESYYDHRFNNKLYAGRRRFMTQYVEQFPIPKLSPEQKTEILTLVKSIAQNIPADTAQDEARLDALIWQAFGL
ncbi:Eco57I restriction-modification methylase domain-containing protein [Bdellovibrio sp. HCB337]|uniref:Eco57I restriction-modification methylase domain-containing protein n=1 Tax=Bdellovibrio sp. HCB337 TaxID=3394358 RepID=UPI0039A6D25E